VGELAVALVGLKSAFSNEESSIRTPCCMCSSPQSQLAVFIKYYVPVYYHFATHEII